jgi:hypothetical protein
MRLGRTGGNAGFVQQTRCMVIGGKIGGGFHSARTRCQTAIRMGEGKSTPERPGPEALTRAGVGPIVGI